jgi:hypothetical protein
MKPGTLISLLLLFATTLLTRAQETNSPGRPDFQDFRIISERNIFNPNRSPRRERSRSDREPDRRTRTESVALLGTMNYEKGWFAFFDGSRSDYRKALQPGDAIAGYTIGEIAPNHVKLESTNSPPIQLRVGTQMRKQDEGEWEIRDRFEAVSTPTAPATTAGDTNAAAASSTADESDIVKKLMQKREQELEK